MSEPRLRPEVSLDFLMGRGEGHLPGQFGLRGVALQPGRLVLAMDIQPWMLAPNGFLHAASVIALADTCAGYATVAHLPEGAQSFTTIELKSNFFATRREGELQAHASLIHGGRQTQVWDVDVRATDTDQRLALFRCTQMVLWPRS